VEEQSFAAFGQLLRPGGRLVVLDPNPNWILRAARVLASHRDFQTPLDEARRVLERYGFRVRSVDFYEVMGLPLSGGYVFKELVPRIRPLHELVAGLNLLLSRLVARAGLGPAICWRYVIAADFDPARSSGAVPSSTAPEAR
jgi:SAM-dependent methyltransferase